jgi:hypothetical protein
MSWEGFGVGYGLIEALPQHLLGGTEEKPQKISVWIAGIMVEI